MKTNFSKLSIVCLIMAMTAVFFNSCKSDDNSNDPITPQPEAVKTVVGFVVSSNVLDCADITATHVDANGKETPLQFVNPDSISKKDFDAYEDSVINKVKVYAKSNNPNATLRLVRGVVTGTTAKAFTNKINFTIKLQDGCRLSDNHHFNIQGYAFEKVGTQYVYHSDVPMGIHSDYFTGNESIFIADLEKVAKEINITSTVK
ncbi:MAG: hypothetical protein HUK07_06685 [Bacteroidaceae bacterium]|nr:hypothetical protein [Bacteroidaceae bacterium]